MKSVVLIIPYFGKLPDYFPIWKMSALKNETVNFLFFTDIEELQSEKNISVVHLSFEEFRKRVQQKFDFPIALKYPYKLCDYRPAYGYVLSEYIREYDFWGNCDIDLIFGDIRRFLTEDILKSYQKILEHGHFTLYRNDQKINEVFMRCAGYKEYDYKKVYTSEESMYFDECLGTQLIFRKENIPVFYDPSLFFDVQVNEKNFRHLGATEGSTIFHYDSGRLYALEKKGGGILQWEIMYVHFQKRRMDYKNFQAGQPFYVIPNRLISADTSPREEWFRSSGRKLYRLQKKILHVREYLNRYRKGSYPSFGAYRAERKKFRRDMICAKREVEKYREQV